MTRRPAYDAPLGVFDSGVGGLTVLSALKRQLPHESFVYLGDTARVPYGSKPLEMVRGFASEISLELLSRGVKGIVVACNTASAASLPDLAGELPVPVWGVIEPGVEAALGAAPGGLVGVLGTVGTVGTGVYQRRLEAAGCRVWARACPLFVPIVEEGVSDTVIAELVARHYLGDAPALDAVILGCTHYPALKPILSQVLGGGPSWSIPPRRPPPGSPLIWMFWGSVPNAARRARSRTSSPATCRATATPPGCWAGRRGA